jgi:hypothetical protein
MTRDLKQLMDKAVPVKDYLSKTIGAFRSKSDEVLQTYQLKKDAVEELKKYADRLYILVFSAEWCLKDCAPQVPILQQLNEKIGLKVGILGGLMRDPLNAKQPWRIPPSPAEVNDFNVVKVPTIIIFDTTGRQIGTIIERPAPGKTLEEAILELARVDLR